MVDAVGGNAAVAATNTTTGPTNDQMASQAMNVMFPLILASYLEDQLSISDD